MTQEQKSGSGFGNIQSSGKREPTGRIIGEKEEEKGIGALSLTLSGSMLNLPMKRAPVGAREHGDELLSSVVASGTGAGSTP